MTNFVPVVYSGGGPVMRTDGKTQRVAAPPLAQWLEAYDALHVFRGRGHVVYYQTQGTGVAASGPTHNCGSAWDEKYTSAAAIMDAREMGADLQHRIPGRDGWPSDGADHNHGVLPCGYNDCNQYQYDAYLAGFNGLGKNGHAAHDRLPKPSVIRTWQQGIAWAQAQMGASPMTQTTTQEDDMTPDQDARLTRIEATLAALAQKPASKRVSIVDPVTKQGLGIGLVVGGVLYHPANGDTLDAAEWVHNAPPNGQIGTNQLADILAMQAGAEVQEV